ncbi:GntR family transcriptional regulator [Anaerocolumna cellulosilytica]|uniref:GntR family transcriptional regulator n=1 Tax=Anaerocolumna cellulosilytica TaxID=433286 RepID=A0A6S6QVL7_9FIRM|nr:TrkA C-terminal domain-containing protein [Anaerocolumna cellulosilytica]MBB5197081.1 K+/H+ antiporter YhaU regulatory subunit KhtT [Anaerocolumna cellulosilytica]BCJ95293.1 GntR family transcriptional regulator [Anaerocolumna cellulosilytica]
MEKKPKITTPRYQQIATDIAAKIVDKQYSVGDKIYARSSLASTYGVSSETARRAISILSDLNIVDTTKGSGVVIKSYENALKFVRQYKDIQTINNLKHEIMESVERQTKELEHFNQSLIKLIDHTDRFRSINPFVPFELEITPETPYLNKTIEEVNFWHNTTATIIAIKRNDSLIMSPGPYAVFMEQDILYFVGDENSQQRARIFMYPDNTSTNK